MRRKSVAVLDIRSSGLAVIVGERGVNNTFVIRASKTEEYDGYENGKFYDERRFSEAVSRAVTAAEQTIGESLTELYIGVPGMFTEIVPKEQTIGFAKKRRIGQREIDALFESGKEERKGFRFLRATSMIFITADDRRVVNPVGLSSLKLSGLLSYFYCSEYFCGVLEEGLGRMNIAPVYLPAEFAAASYLIPSETRDEYALFLDTGFLSSTVLVLLGGGVLLQKTCWAGKGQIVVRLMRKFDLPYEAALALLAKANLYAKKNAGRREFYFGGVSYEYDSDELVEAVKEGLDELCEELGSFLEECTGKELDYKPLLVSGDGITDIRGALEHIGKRLNRVCEPLAPDLPYYNKPEMSSRIALIDMACGDRYKKSFLNRLLGGYGG